MNDPDSIMTAAGGKPLVSVVVPVYNAAGTLPQTIRSLREQSLGSWEAIVVDDASTDGSHEVAQELAAQDARIRVDRLRANGGPALARNRALEQAQGRYLAFLDADDRWHAAKLRRQVQAMQEADGAVMSHTSAFLIQDGTALLHKAKRRIEHRHLLQRNRLINSSVVVDRELAGDFRIPQLKWRQDWAAWLELLRAPGSWALGLPQPLVRIYKIGQSHSAKKYKVSLQNWNVLRKHERLPLHRALPNFGAYAVHGVARHLQQKAVAGMRRRGK